MSAHISKPEFLIGKLLAAPTALEALQEADVDIVALDERHMCRKWGVFSDKDKQLNDETLHDGSRILSAYILLTEVKNLDHHGRRERKRQTYRHHGIAA